MTRVEPILLKKLAKCDAQWIITKTVLVWAIDTAQQILMLPIICRDKLAGSLAVILNRAEIFPKEK